MNFKIQKLCLPPTSSLHRVIARIDCNEKGIALITDKGGRLVCTVTDRDMRLGGRAKFGYAGARIACSQGRVHLSPAHHGADRNQTRHPRRKSFQNCAPDFVPRTLWRRKGDH